MRVLILVVLLIASTCGAQEPALYLQQPLSRDQGQGLSQQPSTSQAQMIVIPEGTRIPVTLSSPITTKSARPGNPVRAVTSFPVTVGSQVAIPVGTYAEGVIDKVTKGGRLGTTLRMHFTRIVYANGYTVTVDGFNTDAKVTALEFAPESNSPEPVAFARDGGPHLVLTAQQSPPALPPLPHSNVGTAVGIGIGVSAAGLVAIILLAHHRGGSSSGLLFDTGWQFEMVLQSPLSVDAASVAAAVATPGA